MEVTIEKLWNEHLAKDLPFVVYKKPNAEQVIAMFQQNDTLFTVDDFEEEGFVMAPFYEGVRFYIPTKHSVVVREKMIKTALDIEKTYSVQDQVNAKRDFELLVTNCIKAINDGYFGKVVPSRREVIEIDQIEVIELFRQLITAYPSAFTYVIFHPKVGMWVGATPETLLSVHGNEVKTMALAGTQVNYGQENVEWGEKEKLEQQFVTDFIVEQLKPFTTDHEISTSYTKRAAKVMHICTDIASTMTVKSIQPIIEALHPTPAVCGMPKIEARQFLLDNEGYNRKYYSGYLGELNRVNRERKSTELFVNLRCMEIESKQVNLYIGCGVTKDSDPESEFFETVNKATTMKKILY